MAHIFGWFPCNYEFKLGSTASQVPSNQFVRFQTYEMTYRHLSFRCITANCSNSSLF